MAHKRSRAVFCPKCGETSFLTVNLDDGRLEHVVLPLVCKFPAQCPHDFVAGAFDRRFGEEIIRPTHIGAKEV